MNLAAEWVKAKEAERVAVEARRALEDRMCSLFGIPETLDGTEKLEHEGYEVKIVGRMNRKVNTELLNELSAQEGLQTYIYNLFRWTAELREGAWKNTSPEITSKLAGAITTTPGRPSFSISPKEGQE